MKNIILLIFITISYLGFSQLDKKVSIDNLKVDIEALKLQLSIEEMELLGQTIMKLYKNNQIYFIDGKSKMSYRDVLSIATKDLIRFKDGKYVNKTGFINSCIKAYSSYNTNNSYGICNCAIEQFADNFSSTEFESIAGESMFIGESKTASAAHLARNKKIQNIVLLCLKSYPEIADSFSNIPNTKESIELAAKLHLEELKSSNREEYNELSRYVNMKNYSECFIRTLRAELGSEMKKALYDDPEFLRKVENIQINCIEKNLK